MFWIFFLDRLFIDMKTIFFTVSIYFKAQVKTSFRPLSFSATEIGVKGLHANIRKDLYVFLQH